jgi:hypothetical protein
MTQQGKGEVTTVPFSSHQLHRLLIHGTEKVSGTVSEVKRE